MTSDWMDLGLVTDVLNVLHQHGYARRDTEHATRAILLINDLGRIYDGTLDHPSGPSLSQAAPPQTAPAPPRPAGHNAVVLPASDITTVLAALDEAAEYKRDLAAACPDCAGQSCGTCQWRLQAARDYDQAAVQIRHAAGPAAAPHQAMPDRDQPAHGQPQAATDREAGQ